jgi:hypothetical protein
LQYLALQVELVAYAGRALVALQVAYAGRAIQVSCNSMPESLLCLLHTKMSFSYQRGYGGFGLRRVYYDISVHRGGGGGGAVTLRQQ